VLTSTLLESRQRWQDFAHIGADLLFEVDAGGCFTFLAPDPVLGYGVDELIGRPASMLVAGRGPDPFRGDLAVHDLKTWVIRADGSRRCMAFRVSRLWSPMGMHIGLRGSAHDITTGEALEAAAAAALRRTATLDHLLHRLRNEVSAVHQVRAALSAILPALGCTGIAVVRTVPDASDTAIHNIGEPFHWTSSRPWLRSRKDTFLITEGGTPLAVLPHGEQNGRSTMLVLWRPPGGRNWSQDDQDFAHSASELLRVLLGTEMQEQELRRQARTDALTNLLNRRSFLAELSAVMACGDAGGALLFTDLDNFKHLNDTLGHEAGDAALVKLANILCDAVRPTDLVARFGGDEFVLWLHGASSAVATARAASILSTAATSLGPLCHHEGPKLSLSIGIAVRAAADIETPVELLKRADASMYAAKRAGRACWCLDEGTRTTTSIAGPTA